MEGIMGGLGKEAGLGNGVAAGKKREVLIGMSGFVWTHTAIC